MVTRFARSSSGGKPPPRSSLREWHSNEQAALRSSALLVWDPPDYVGPLLARGTSPLDGWLRHLWRSAGRSSLPHRLEWRQTLVPRALASYVDPFGATFGRSYGLRLGGQAPSAWRLRLQWGSGPPSSAPHNLFGVLLVDDRIGRGFVPHPLPIHHLLDVF